MSTAIVYQGVPGARGTLFQELKFFVTQRIPNRTTILDMITQNGGKIAMLDKQADIIIADHVRPDCPPRSLSWKFVEDSITYGAVQEKDKYRIHQSPQALRPVGSSRTAASSAPSKGTRTPFNNADDAILAKWVLGHSQKGGNEIYKTLEEINNRHTWQSWRDRWVKKLSKMSQQKLEEMAAAAPDNDLSGSTSASSPQGGVARATRARSTIPPREVEPSLLPPKRNNFTEEDDHLLIRKVSEAEKNHHVIGPQLFRDIAEECPRHAAKSWQKHWNDILKPRRDQTAASNEALPDEPPVPTKPITDTASIGESSRQNEKDEKSHSRPVALSEENGTPEVVGAAKKALLVASSAGRKNDTPPGTITARRNGDTRSTERSAERQGGAPPVASTETRSGISEKAQKPEKEISQAVTEDAFSKDDFLDRLTMYREMAQLEVSIDLRIDGQSVDVWLLYQAVKNAYQRNTVEVDWEMVATDMGFGIHAAKPLQDCYNEYLLEFLRSPVLDVSLSDSESEEEEEQEGADDDRRSQDREEVDVEAQEQPTHSLPKVSPSTNKKKHAITAEANGPPWTPHDRRKRRRLDPNHEIPSTPEEKLGLASLVDLGPTPSLRVRREPSEAPAEEVMVGMERAPVGKPRRLEPETQDFGFDNLNADADYSPRRSTQSTSFDISPSQQLLGEVEAIPPVSLSFDNPKKAKAADRLKTADPDSTRSLPAEDMKQAPQPKEDEAEPESQDGAVKIAEVDRIIDQLARYDIPRKSIIRALMATSLCIPLATDVLRHWKSHGYFPKDWEGVWTEKDDQRLRRVDGAGSDEAERAKVKKYWGRLVDKHTERRVEKRREFLAYMDEVERSSQ
ncbi:Telomeric repeat-binding factor 2-interacting protein 1 [Colletotrichum chlorophyti]|uniref:DNA-binding protein RAP1 n=1 Tax=Colletotrichum chlorophyti TaxID=708187 RepID=A0A1Q8RLB7_9PEZI|nr:Telomeric repeat-binding factor 2-interacting protein 1 [Colletotrichum chlorophyti]